MTHTSKYFYGNKISDYGLKHGYVDYRTLAKCFDAVLNNDIMQKTWGIVGEWEQESGFVDNSDEISELEEKLEELEDEIVELQNTCEQFEDDENADLTNELDAIEVRENEIAEIKKQIEELENEQEYPSEIFQYYIVDDDGARILKEADEIVYYNEELDMYVWGVTHWGTSWDYVLTNIKVELENN